MSSQQTHFTTGQPHFSQHHANHKLGSTAGVQTDFQLRLPNNKVHSYTGQTFIGQTDLPMFIPDLRKK